MDAEVEMEGPEKSTRNRERDLETGPAGGMESAMSSPKFFSCAPLMAVFTVAGELFNYYSKIKVLALTE